MPPHKIDTRVIHAGEPQPRIGGAVNVPIFQSTVYDHQPGASYHDILYPRLNNLPNHQALNRKLADLEEAEAAVVTASGMAAISTSLLAVLAGGGHLLAQRGVYGGTHSLVTADLPSYGITCDLIDSDNPSSWRAKLQPTTRAIYVETIGNPLLSIPDLRAVVAFAKQHGLVSMIDNTFATPINFCPISLGFDLSLHSCTKYLNGHSDLVAGVVIGSASLVERIKQQLDHLGGCLDPHACFLLHRGLKTLALRVRAQNDNALALARALQGRAELSRVVYPGLADHPQHERARELFDHGFGGMMAIELAGGEQAALRFIDALSIPIHSASLGGVETLVTRPVVTSHAGVPEDERAALGISDALIRVSVGIEAADDLIADFTQAL